MVSLAFVAVAIALTVPGMVFAIRALPWVARQVDAGVKPWACDICSCFWLTGGLGLAAGASLGWAHLLTVGPAYTLAMIVLSFMERPSTPPPMLPFEPKDGLAERLEP